MIDDKEKTFNVGDIIFCVKKKNAIVIPMKIVEVTTKTTLEGTTRAYGASDLTGVVINPTTSGFDEIFSSAEDAYCSLVSRFETAIRGIVDKASEDAKILTSNGVNTSQMI